MNCEFFWMFFVHYLKAQLPEWTENLKLIVVDQAYDLIDCEQIPYKSQFQKAIKEI